MTTHSTFRRPRGRPPHPDVLTPAEWRVLHLVRHGMRRRAIAEHLGISENAIKYHLSNIATKLGVSGLLDLRAWPGYPATSPVARRSRPMTTEPTVPTATDAADTTRLARVGQISLYVRDIGRAERFYRDALRLPHLFTFGNLGFFDCGGVRLYLHAVEDTDWRPGSIVYFVVGDIVAAAADLQARGVGVRAQPHLVHRHDDGDEEWMAFFDDPDGNQLALMSRVPGSAPAGTSG